MQVQHGGHKPAPHRARHTVIWYTSTPPPTRATTRTTRNTGTHSTCRIIKTYTRHPALFVYSRSKKGYQHHHRLAADAKNQRKSTSAMQDDKTTTQTEDGRRKTEVDTTRRQKRRKQPTEEKTFFFVCWRRHHVCEDPFGTNKTTSSNGRMSDETHSSYTMWYTSEKSSCYSIHGGIACTRSKTSHPKPLCFG